MASNLPESEVPDIRDYIYVDAGRVRSLVSQLRGGLPQTQVETGSRSRRLRAGIKFLEGEAGSTSGLDETRVLDDLYVSMLEEDAAALGLLQDVSEQAQVRKSWLRGKLRLAPGELIRVNAPTRLFDPHQVVESLVKMQSGFGEAMADVDDTFGQMIRALPALYPDALSLRVMPCGEDSPECSFVGLIPKPDVTLGVDRDTLFSRLGADAPDLTCVLQVARTLEKRTTNMHSLATAGDLLQFDDDQGLARDGMDKFLVEIMRMLEGMGFLEAPRHPGIAVTPLAIYRQVPQSTALASQATDED